MRKQLAAQKTPLGRGRPRSPQAKQAARRNDRLQRKVGDLFEHRHLFVAQHLTPAERRMLRRITRGLPHLQHFREIMGEVYRLFDRRCRSDTALTYRCLTCCQKAKDINSLTAIGSLTEKADGNAAEAAGWQDA